jgi:hypothetical protein
MIRSCFADHEHRLPLSGGSIQNIDRELMWISEHRGAAG